MPSRLGRYSSATISLMRFERASSRMIMSTGSSRDPRSVSDPLSSAATVVDFPLAQMHPCIHKIRPMSHVEQQPVD